MISKLLHDPQNYVAKTLDQAIQKLSALNEMYDASLRWEDNLYLATRDLEEKYKHDFIRYLANPASIPTSNIGDQLEEACAKEIPRAGHNQVSSNYEQTYTLKPSKNGRDYDVLVTNTQHVEKDDEKSE